MEVAESNLYTHTFTHTYESGYYAPFCTVGTLTGLKTDSDPASVIVAKWKFKKGQTVKVISEDYARMGIMWSAHFQDACSAFGMEHALMTMLMNPDMLLVLQPKKYGQFLVCLIALVFQKLVGMVIVNCQLPKGRK